MLLVGFRNVTVLRPYACKLCYHKFITYCNSRPPRKVKHDETKTPLRLIDRIAMPGDQNPDTDIKLDVTNCYSTMVQRLWINWKGGPNCLVPVLCPVLILNKGDGSHMREAIERNSMLKEERFLCMRRLGLL